MAREDTRTIEHDRTWTLSDMLALKVPSDQITLREYLVALTVEEGMDVHLSDWSEHVSALNVDCDAVVQHLMNTDGELCVRVGVKVVAFNPG
jgi:hypothetical protein